MNSTHHLSIPDLSCAHCVATVTAALAAVPTLSGTHLDLRTKQARFVLGDATRLADALARLDQAGYPAQPLAGT